jgi:glycosyltransferase involved in cell wall biosynthesis
LYIATGESHKNHVNLLEAWKLLASEGLYPSLCLTVSEADYPGLSRIIQQAKTQHKLNLENEPTRSRSDLQRLYDQSQALIYPSVLESFGLPLLEARQAGLSVIAAELDYVRDLIDPEEVFDPRSPQSIARAVKRFLNVPETSPLILTSEAFVNRLLAV